MCMESLLTQKHFVNLPALLPMWTLPGSWWFHLGVARLSSRATRDVTKAQFLLHFGLKLGQLHLMQRQTVTKMRGSCVQALLTHKNLSSFQKPQSMSGTHALSYIKEQWEHNVIWLWQQKKKSVNKAKASSLHIPMSLKLFKANTQICNCFLN